MVRDGNIWREDIGETMVQKVWGRWDVLHGDATFSNLWWGFFSSLFVRSDKESESNDLATALMTDFTTGSIISLEWLLDDSQQKNRFVVIEYCPHSQDICKQAAKAWVRTYFENTIESPDYTIRPFMWNIWGIDELIWAGEVCVPFQKLADYHKEIYAIKTLTPEALGTIGKKLKVENFWACLEEVNVKLVLRNQIQSAKNAFQLSSIPTYVIIDTKSNKRLKVPWLYPLNDIDALLIQEHPDALKTTDDN